MAAGCNAQRSGVAVRKRKLFYAAENLGYSVFCAADRRRLL